jgi:protease IV
MELTPLAARRSFKKIFFLFCLGALAMYGLTSGLRSYLDGSLPMAKNKVAVVEVQGIITDSREVVSQIVDYRNDPSIGAIILRIDSPGGSVGPSQEIYSEVLKTRKVKKIVASLGSVAASGGYYIASPASHIVANPGTLTGSIGVIMAFSNVEELIQKIGLKPMVIKAGKFKDAGSVVRPMTDEENVLLQSVVDDVHNQFIEAISTGRELSIEDVKKVADGRIFSGRQALEYKLVDQLGGFEDSLEFLKKSLQLTKRPSVVFPEKESSLLDFLLENKLAGALSQSLGQLTFPKLQFLIPLGLQFGPVEG